MDPTSRLLLDLLTVTLLGAVAGGALIGAVNRFGEERGRSWLFLSLLFFSLAISVFLDNALGSHFFPGERALSWRIPFVVACEYGVFSFSILCLAEELPPRSRSRRTLHCAALLLSNAPIASLLTLRMGWVWYRDALSAYILAAFGLASVFAVALAGLALFARRPRPEPRGVVVYCGVSVVGLYVFAAKVWLELNPRLYESQSWFVLTPFLLAFVFLLSRESNLEYRELKELRKAQALLRDIGRPGTSRPETSGIEIAEGSLPFPTTERERLIVEGLCDGRLYKEIALDLGISLSAVKKGAHSVYRKAGAQNRVELINTLASVGILRGR